MTAPCPFCNLPRDRIRHGEFSPAGYNIGINDGAAAGQTAPGRAPTGTP
jgi:hypothetical protein